MSLSKRLMERQEDQLRIATEIARQAGVLSRCEFHDLVYNADSGDDSAAYKLGNYRFSKGELEGLFATRLELTDAIKSSIENAAIDCYACEKQRSE